ncbi:GDP-L-fucose synthase family protein [Terriglobus saanensis]|uniref:GDP-L-fucose synthase n=1 Tax=Terriglobus saanensis (strain ATCC BAA-1853 / DSM 23119 / SP1PR4) TaxID=401053 RepID=E8V339_TERSS|nr:GDP-L-fucose synthase [Terriglobus saanensis]ADV81314.1 NAD-dependent epimerase/dehydratase [Terriglobus saanensis SP1PR4]
MMMQSDSRIFVAGHRGLVGSSLVRGLQRKGFTNLLTQTRAQLDLSDREAVAKYFEETKPEYVFLAAAKVGGILANDTLPADFIRDNLDIQNSVIEASYQVGVKRLLFLGSSCIYPKACPQPIREEYLLTGPLEQTNRAYALAKIAGIEMCWAYNRQYGTKYLAAMPSNLYGPGDNFDLQSSHVLPALIRKAHAAKKSGSEFVVWGSGKPQRELLYSDDLADACLYLMSSEDALFDTLLKSDEPPLINIGAGSDVTIRELADLVAKVVGFEGAMIFDASKPDGTPKKLMDSTRMRGLGWAPKVGLEDGIRSVYEMVKNELD